MKNIILLFLFLIPAFLFAQYPATGNKSRLGYQTTGDGLIWRGVAADTAIKPRTTANAYFQLDTVNRVLRRYIATQGSWQVVGSSSVNIDSLIYATRYWVGSNYFPLEGGTLTGTGGAGFIGLPSQGTAPGTPASGLNIFAQGSSFNWKGTDGFERQITSSLTGGRNYALPDINGTFTLGTGTADRSGRWTGTNTLAAGNITDNGTKLQALLPWQYQSWTTAGRPTGVDGYKGRNSTTGFEEGYFTSQWENYITSIGATANQLAIFSSAGKVYGNSILTWDNTNNRLAVNTASPAARLSVGSSNGGPNSTMALQLNANNASAVLSYISMDFINPGGVLYGQFFGTASNYANAGVNLGSNSNGFLNENNNGMLLLGAAGTNGYVSFNTGGYAVANERMRILANGNVGIGTTSAQRLFHVAGAARITGTAGTATDILGRDGNGDLSNLSLSGLGISGGVLTAQNFANTNLTATGNRVHDWANYNFTWANMKKFMWGADSLFKITKEFSGLTYSILRNPSGQSLLDIQGDDDAAGNSAEIRLTDTETGNIVFLAHDDRGFGSDGFRLEHFNTTNYHNSLFIDKTSRLFHINQGEKSSGTMYQGDASINTGLAKTIVRGTSATTNTDSIMAVHYFRTTNNRIKNKDIFGVYSANGAVDTMYLRLDKVGRMFQYKDAFLTQNVTFSSYGTPATTAAALSKTLTNYGVGFATDGTVTSREIKRDTTIYVTDADYNFAAAITSAQVLARYNRIIIYSKLTSGSTSDNQIFLHTPSSDFLQCEIIIYSNDASADSDATSIDFTTNGAVDGAGGTLSSYGMSAGQRVEIRVADDGGYKWFFN